MVIVCGVFFIRFFHCQPPEQSNFDQILNELNILTQRQLQSSPTPTPSISGKSDPTTSSLSSPLKSKLNSTGSNQRAFQLPNKYDPNKLPKYSRIKPLTISVNMTVLHVTLDKHENIITLDLEMKECWKDKRLKIKKNADKNNEDDEEMMMSDDDEEDGSDGRLKKIESYFLESEWASRIWHPMSRLQANAEVANPYSPTSTDAAKQGKPKIIEQESLIENIYILANETTATVWMSLKLRLNIPSYECQRDESTLYPFDRIKCSFNIANGLC